MVKRIKKLTRRTFGLVGKNISYSFSSGYFKEKFDSQSLDNCEYLNFDIENIEAFPELLSIQPRDFAGLNVTIPYKQAIIPYLDGLHSTAAEIGAVNTIRITKKGILKGYNTDAYGFEKSIIPLLDSHHKKGLILGTGGASLAVAYVLKKLQIEFLWVSRNPKNDQTISYSKLDDTLLQAHHIIINCTPLGTFPETDRCPDIPYQFLSNQHLLYDLIYNPAQTEFLSRGKKQGAITKNGLEMLQLQAEKSWQIWNR